MTYHSSIQTSLLTIPGLSCSGPDHWQTLWEQRRPDCARAELPDWDDPDPERWIDALDRAVAGAAGKVVLIAHSLGCHAVVGWAFSGSPAVRRRVAGALLVAPPDAERPSADGRIARFAITPFRTLPFPAAVVASRDDPYATFARSEAMAAGWDAELIDVGTLGHINADSGIGAWVDGQRLAERFFA